MALLPAMTSQPAAAIANTDGVPETPADDIISTCFPLPASGFPLPASRFERTALAGLFLRTATFSV
jgi:hypothetical protein